MLQDEQAAKMYLLQVLRVDLIVESNDDQRSWLEWLASKRDGPSASINGYIAELVSENQTILDTRTDVLKTIEEIEGPVERRIIKMRYLEQLPWSCIVKQLIYSSAQVHRIHNKTLKEIFQKIKPNIEFVQNI